MAKTNELTTEHADYRPVVGPVRRIVLVVGVYLLVSFPPYLYFNWDAVADRSLVLAVAIGGTGLVLVVAGAVLARDGLARYAGLLLGRTDGLTVVAKATFVLAAASWWLVPEFVFAFDLGIGLPVVLTAIALAHAPVAIFLSLSTIVGESKRLPY